VALPAFDREKFLDQELGKVVGEFRPKESPWLKVRRALLVAILAVAMAVAVFSVLEDQSSPFARPPDPAKVKKPVPIQLLPPR
jgi:hypothetical protein